jgi:hypothetical protein
MLVEIWISVEIQPKKLPVFRRVVVHCVETGQTIIMQQVPPEHIEGSIYNTDIGEWVLQDLS